MRFIPSRASLISMVRWNYCVEVQVSKSNSGSEVIKLFSCSTQVSMKFYLLLNLKLLTNANSFLLNNANHEIFSAKK